VIICHVSGQLVLGEINKRLMFIKYERHMIAQSDRIFVPQKSTNPQNCAFRALPETGVRILDLVTLELSHQHGGRNDRTRWDFCEIAPVQLVNTSEMQNDIGIENYVHVAD
jgi:hypothetical protein